MELKVYNCLHSVFDMARCGKPVREWMKADYNVEAERMVYSHVIASAGLKFVRTSGQVDDAYHDRIWKVGDSKFQTIEEKSGALISIEDICRLTLDNGIAPEARVSKFLPEIVRYLKNCGTISDHATFKSRIPVVLTVRTYGKKSHPPIYVCVKKPIVELVDQSEFDFLETGNNFFEKQPNIGHEFFSARIETPSKVLEVPGSLEMSHRTGGDRKGVLIFDLSQPSIPESGQTEQLIEAMKVYRSSLSDLEQFIESRDEWHLHEQWGTPEIEDDSDGIERASANALAQIKGDK